MSKYIVYEIYNKITSKRYIGSTSRFISKRKLEHLRLLRKNNHYNKYLQKDFNNFKEVSFEFNILNEYNTKEDMLLGETFYMNKYGGINSSNIYNYQDNITKNIEYSRAISKSNKGRKAWNKNRKMTASEIETNRNSHLGIKRTFSSIEKQKLSIANNPNFGNRNKKLSIETKQKISEKNRGRKAYNKGKRNLNHKYDSLVPVLRNEYSILKSYKKVQQLHPEIDYSSINRLIKFGYLSKIK